MQRIEHIGIAVKSLKESIPLYEKLLNTKCYKIEQVESEQVNTAFFKLAEPFPGFPANKIELLESATEEGVIAKFIEKKGEGIHHIAYAVDDIQSEMHRLEGEGFELLNKEPKAGADSKLICFLHPKTTGGVLVELCMDRKE